MCSRAQLAGREPVGVAAARRGPAGPPAGSSPRPRASRRCRRCGCAPARRAGRAGADRQPASRCRTASASSRSAIGDRQMLPMQTCRTVNGGTQASPAGDGRAPRRAASPAGSRRRAAPAAPSPVTSTIVLRHRVGARPRLQVDAHRVARAGRAPPRRWARAGWPVLLADETAIGPVSRSTSSADRVQRHPHGDRAAGVAQVPLQARRVLDDDRQRARPERLDQVPGRRAAARRPGRRGCAGSRPAPAAACAGPRPLALSSAVTACGVNASAPIAVDRVGGQDDQLAALDRLDRRGDAPVAVGDGPAVVEHHEEPVCHAARVTCGSPAAVTRW